tara:strand:- start:5288 stop:5458 length:171 start_codon:yes stop_codon:yes gene_type:complete
MKVYYKKPSGEVIEYNPSRMVKESLDRKFIKCDKHGNQIKEVVKKEVKKSKKKASK